MTFEEQIEAIVDKRIAESNKPLLDEIAILKADAELNGSLIDSDEVYRLTGIKDMRTQKKYFTAVPKPGKKGEFYFKRYEITKYRIEQQLPPTPELKIAS